MALQNHAHQVEAQAAAAGAPAAGALLPVEGIKEMGQGAVGDVDAGVFHLQNGDTPLRPDGDAHLGPLRGVAGGVGEQVVHRPAQQGGVPLHIHAGGEAQLQGHAPLLQQLGVGVQPGGYQGRQLQPLPLLRLRPRLHAGDREDLPHQGLHAVRRPEGAGQVSVPIPVHPHPVQHAPQLALQDGHRGFQLVGGGGEEGQPAALLRPGPLHVVPQGGVGGFQLRQGGGEAPGHLVQAAAQQADLVGAALPALPLEVQLRHLPGDGADADDGLCQISGVPHRAQQGEGQQGQGQPGGHPAQGLHRLVGQAERRGDQQLVGLRPVGKGHVGGQGPGHGGGHHSLCAIQLYLVVAALIGGHRIGLLHGGGDGHVEGARVRRYTVGAGQGHRRPAVPDKLVQNGAGVGQVGLGQPGDQPVHLGLEALTDHSGVGDGGGPGDEGEGEHPRPQQQDKGEQKNPGRQMLTDALSEHDSPPPVPSRCSPPPAFCGGF